MEKKRFVQDSESSETETEVSEKDDIINVDFDYFDLDPEIDFETTKIFLTQLFNTDSSFIDISSLSNIILKNGGLGSSVKLDGKDSDPYAILSVLDLQKHQKLKCIDDLIKYLCNVLKNNDVFHKKLSYLLLEKNNEKIGIIISERLVNMPLEISPPMYKMLIEEMDNFTNTENQNSFSSYLIISRVYDILPSELKSTSDKSSNKKKKNSKDVEKMDYYHYEDTVFEKNSTIKGYFEYLNSISFNNTTNVHGDYGVNSKLSLILIDDKFFRESVKEIQSLFPYK